MINCKSINYFLYEIHLYNNSQCHVICQKCFKKVFSLLLLRSYVIITFDFYKKNLIFWRMKKQKKSNNLALDFPHSNSITAGCYSFFCTTTTLEQCVLLLEISKRALQHHHNFFFSFHPHHAYNSIIYFFGSDDENATTENRKWEMFSEVCCLSKREEKN